MRNVANMVVVEDDRVLSAGLREHFERVGGFEVWVAALKSQVLDVLDRSLAYWLILDLELEDGDTTDLVPVIREKYGSDIFILVLTGYWERHKETHMLEAGVDICLRKPYSPQALLMQINKHKNLIEGIERVRQNGRYLRVGDAGVLNMDTGVYITSKGSHKKISFSQKQLVEKLASARDSKGDWAEVSRGDLLMSVYGDVTLENLSMYGTRLRKLTQRLRRFFAVPHLFETLRNDTNNVTYVLVPEVTIVNKWEEE